MGVGYAVRRQENSLVKRLKDELEEDLCIFFM